MSQTEFEKEVTIIKEKLIKLQEELVSICNNNFSHTFIINIEGRSTCKLFISDEAYANINIVDDFYGKSVNKSFTLEYLKEKIKGNFILLDTNNNLISIGND